ncbi:uncharacterized protein JCM15063_003503 [Sporobolomyces koalae]|uniref:uncharacterized protein n=1 Tax=Sporobolomyces koalae TaxID=500713 RepID=UPI003171EAFF
MPEPYFASPTRPGRATASPATHRTSVSIQPGEDPFSAPTICFTDEATTDAFDEEWIRVSQDSYRTPESVLAEAEEQFRPDLGKKLRKRPSFLKGSLWNNRLSRSSSVASLRSLKNKISTPILREEAPRTSPMIPHASLVSIEGVTVTDRDQTVSERGPREDNQPRMVTLAPPASRHLSRTQSLHVQSSQPRVSIESTLNQTIGPSGVRRRTTRTLAKSASFDSAAMTVNNSRRTLNLMAKTGETTEQGDTRHEEDLRPVSSASISQYSAVAPAGSSKTIACLYLVAGLGKDPSAWCLAPSDHTSRSPQHLPNAISLRWKPEVIVSLATEGDAEEGSRFEKTEIQQIQRTAIKLAFDREVEIVAAKASPSNTTSFFSFSSGLSKTDRATYHAVSLTVWSRANQDQIYAIRTILANGAIRQEDQTMPVGNIARTSRDLQQNLGQRVSQRQASKLLGGQKRIDDRGSCREFHLDRHPATCDMPATTDFWLPSSVILISTSPQFALLSDVLRLSWARSSGDIALLSRQIRPILNMPLPHIGQRLEVPIDVSQSPTGAYLVTTVAGELDCADVAFPTWPLFKALHSDNILSVAELALAPSGRILFVSEHPIMLSIACMTLRLVLERRGWTGLVRPISHCRDLHMAYEDPGPWLLGADPTHRASVLKGLPSAVVVVDLDANLVTCADPAVDSLSTGAAREKARKKLDAAIGNPGFYSVPLSIVEAFPQGKFRSFSAVKTHGHPVRVERIEPDLAWNWDEERTFSELDSILSEIPRRGTIGRFAAATKPRKVERNPETTRALEMAREHADLFAVCRDELEADIARLNNRLSAVLSVNRDWYASFAELETTSVELVKEIRLLKVRLQEEQQEAARLAAAVAEDEAYQDWLKCQLRTTETAKEEALADLAETKGILNARLASSYRQLEESPAAEPLADVPEEHTLALGVQTVLPRGTSSTHQRPPSGLHPRIASLTPPVSPEHEVFHTSPSYPFVTPRSHLRSIVSKQHPDPPHLLSEQSMTRFTEAAADDSDAVLCSSTARTAFSEWNGDDSVDSDGLSEYGDARSFISTAETVASRDLGEMPWSFSPIFPTSGLQTLEVVEEETTTMRNQCRSSSELGIHPSTVDGHARSSRPAGEEFADLDPPPVALSTRAPSLSGRYKGRTTGRGTIERDRGTEPLHATIEANSAPEIAQPQERHLDCI